LLDINAHFVKESYAMKNNSQSPQFDQPTTYLIKVKGSLDPGWAEWFDRMDIMVAKDEDGAAITFMTGLVVDQVALHGLLTRIRDLNLQLLSVQRLDGAPPTSDATMIN
jgi:hypothetical protein